MSPSSKRFVPTKWSDRLVPAILVILVLLLFLTLSFVILSMLGISIPF